jgi:hypothetical protein
MNQNDGAKFDSGLVALAAVTGKTLDMGIKAAYFTALEDVPLDIVMGALRTAMKVSEFFPSAAEIRTLCDEAEREQERFALQAAQPAGLLPDPDAQYRGETHVEPEPTYHCRSCRDTGWIYFHKENGSRWVRKCDCILEDDDALKNPVIMRRIRHEQDRCGIKKAKYARKREKRERY